MRLWYANTSYKDAEVVVLGCPLDRTSSFLPGARFGPEYIRRASENIESYSLYQDRDLGLVKVCDLGDIEFSFESPTSPLKRVEEEALRIFKDRKIPIFLGGEHTITLPIIEAAKRIYPSLAVIQLDAHTDMRDEYLKERYCHATVMRRVSEIIGKENIFQLGIRSISKEELDFVAHLYKFRVLEYMEEVKREIGDRWVYLSIDLDVLDLSLMPAVATPQPGGISYEELRESLRGLSFLKVIGLDIVEYNPLVFPQTAYGGVVAGILKEAILSLKRR